MMIKNQNLLFRFLLKPVMVDSIGWKPPSDKGGQLTLSIAAHTFPGNHPFS
jgi:hypothetical protein